MTQTPIITTLKSLLLATVLLLPATSYAGEKIDKEKLAAASEEMYKAGNKNYIFADAVKDGLLIPGKPYTYTYDNGAISFNGKPLQEPLKTTYEDKMHKLLMANEGNTRFRTDRRSSKLRLKDLLDEDGTDRTEPQREKENLSQVEKNKYLDTIIDEMVKDNLIADKVHMKIEWNRKGVFVNSKKLKGAAADKYNKMFEEGAGFKPKGIDDGVSVRRNK